MRNAAAVAAEVRQECLASLHRLGGINHNACDALQLLDEDAEQLRALASMIGEMEPTTGLLPSGVYYMLNRIADDVERANNIIRLNTLKPGG